MPPNLVRHASLEQIRIHKARSLARPLAKCFAVSVKFNLSWANQFAPCRVNLTENIQDGVVSVLVLSLVVFLVLVFIIESRRKFESSNSGAPPCRLLRLLGLSIDVFEFIVLQQNVKIILYCHSYSLIWIVRQYGAVFLSWKVS